MNKKSVVAEELMGIRLRVYVKSRGTRFTDIVDPKWWDSAIEYAWRYRRSNEKE